MFTTSTYHWNVNFGYLLQGALCKRVYKNGVHWVDYNGLFLRAWHSMPGLDLGGMLKSWVLGSSEVLLLLLRWGKRSFLPHHGLMQRFFPPPNNHSLNLMGGSWQGCCLNYFVVLFGRRCTYFASSFFEPFQKYENGVKAPQVIP